MKNSMIDEAYEIIRSSDKIYSFTELYQLVTQNLGMSEEEKMSHIGQFYTELTMDGRFLNLGDNNWDLRENHTYARSHIDVNDVYSEVNSDADSDEEDKQEEKAYDAEVEGKSMDEEDKGDDADGEDGEKFATEDVKSLLDK